MSLLRRALGHKEVLIALLVSVVAGGWLGWRLLLRPAQAQVPARNDTTSQLQALLDAGQYADAVTLADSLLAQTPAQSTVLRYRCLAQHLLNDPQAEATADATLAEASTGPDAAVALAVKALEAVRYERLEIAAAKDLATQALQQTGDDAMAGILARVALAAAVRCEADPPNLVALTPADVTALAGQAAQIRQTLEPVLTAQAAPPTAVWRQRLWRWGLALLADAGILATEAGDSAGEPAALATMQQSCPEDAWTCHFNIPAKALAAARQSQPVAGAFDDHARVAMYTAAGYLYAQAGDRMHSDVLFRRGVQAYVRLLNAYDAWTGDQTTTVVPAGQFRTVGQEFYIYRNRVERLAKYSADWWGTRVVRGEATLEDALAACDYKIFRALVRLRADKDTNAVEIAMQEHLRPDFMETMAEWLEKNAYESQSAWEGQRAALLRQVAGEQIEANKVLGEVAQLARPPAAPRDLEAAEKLLRAALAQGPALLATRVQLQTRLTDVLTYSKRYADVLVVLDQITEDLKEGDAYLGESCLCDVSDMDARRYQAFIQTGQRAAAIALAEAVAGDSARTDDVRLRMLKDLAIAHAATDREAASEVYARMENYTVREQQYEKLRQVLLGIVSRVLQQRPVHTESVGP